MKNKKFDKNKHLKSLSRVVFEVSPTRIDKIIKKKLLNKELEKEVKEYLNDI
mgnify:FL=1